MWVTFFALATAASVWFSAASLAVQLREGQARVNAVIESHGRTPDGSHQVSSFVPSSTISAGSEID
jgi:hypothetical protein